MKIFSVLFGLFIGFFSSLTIASDQDAGDVAAVRACLQNFGNNPFNAEKPTFRTMGAKVRVFGIGESRGPLEE